MMSEVAIGACDLAEVLGSAVALNLLFHIPLLWAVIITGLDVLLLLGLQRFGMRTIEAIVLLLVATISVCYYIEIFVLPQTQPSFLEMGRALVSPHLRQSGILYLAIGIIGATVMPHNLYLHSASFCSSTYSPFEDATVKIQSFPETRSCAGSCRLPAQRPTTQ
jgi:manganese transport protein